MGLVGIVKRNDLGRLRKSLVEKECEQGNIDQALLVASEAGYTEIVRCLVQEGGANVLCTTTDRRAWKHCKSYHSYPRRTALDLATQNGHSETAAYLNDAMGPIGVLKATVEFLRFRCHAGVPAPVDAFAVAEQKIQENGRDINYCNKGDQETQLHAACALLAYSKNYSTMTLPLIEALLERGARVDAVNQQGRTPLACVCLFSCCGESLHMVVRMLLEYGADPNARDMKGDTPFSLACQRSIDNHALLNQLITAGAKINTRNEVGGTPLHHMCWRYHPSNEVDLVTLLLDNGASETMDTQAGYFGSTQLHIAVSRGREKTAVLLLRAGASPNMRDESGDSALHLVCGPSGRSDLVELLLGHGASINVQNRDGNTPLIIALQRGNGLARRLLELPEIETHHTNNKGDNALVAACSRGDLNILYILLRFRLGELGRLF